VGECEDARASLCLNARRRPAEALALLDGVAASAGAACMRSAAYQQIGALGIAARYYAECKALVRPDDLVWTAYLRRRERHR